MARSPAPLLARALMLAAAALATPRPTPAATAATLRFADASAGRPLALYRAPAPYQEPGRPHLNSLIITSRPIRVRNQQQPGERPGAATALPASGGSGGSGQGFLRRSMLVTTEKPAVTLSIPQFSLDCAHGQPCSGTIALEPATPEPTFKPYPQDVLDKFLKEFANSAKIQVNDQRPDEAADRLTNRLANLYLDSEDPAEAAAADAAEPESAEPDGSEGKSRWSLVHAQTHHHPYDDRDGWVSLEPVPWSTSKVSKWHATHPKRPAAYKPPNRWDTRPPPGWVEAQAPAPLPAPAPAPARPPWGSSGASGPGGGGGDYLPERPSYSGHRPAPLRPWDKPDYDSHKPHWPGGTAGYEDIITDNRPTRWPDPGQGRPQLWPGGGGGGGYPPARPHYEFRPGSRPGGPHGPHGPYGPHGDRHPPSHPEESEGQWVLVSSTKGYAIPHRHKIFQRALAVTAKPISSRRSVRLTVLPALNGTANTTISHGGLLEVESTFQSVDDDQRQQEQQQHQQQHNVLPGLLHDPGQAPPAVSAVRPKTALRAVRVLTAQQPPNTRAVLAAVGAGMVPATLALLAPIVLGRRRRSPATETTLPPPPPAAPAPAPAPASARARTSYPSRVRARR